jgi:hypothetical protein
MLFIGNEVTVREPVLELFGGSAELADTEADEAVWLVNAPAVKVVGLGLVRDCVLRSTSS